MSRQEFLGRLGLQSANPPRTARELRLPVVPPFGMELIEVPEFDDAARFGEQGGGLKHGIPDLQTIGAIAPGSATGVIGPTADEPARGVESALPRSPRCDNRSDLADFRDRGCGDENRTGRGIAPAPVGALPLPLAKAGCGRTVFGADALASRYGRQVCSGVEHQATTRRRRSDFRQAAGRRSW